jgi:GNAT superfamily N-acetyltransferase
VSDLAAIRVVAARESDIPLLLDMARGLAAYERMPAAVTASEDDLRASLFGQRPVAEAALAYVGAEPAGMAVFFSTYSTFLGKPGLYLEDIFVEERWRGRGVGRQLMQYLARIAVDRGCARFEWAVLNWNQPAIGFYEKLGAKPQSDWTVYRLSGEPLARLAATSAEGAG